MKRITAALVAALVLTATGRAEAEILNFDDVNPPDNATRTSLICGETNGFLFRSDHFHVIGTVINTDFSSSGTTHIGYESSRGDPITMMKVGGGTFALLSLDAGEFFSRLVSAHPDAETIVITGIKSDGHTVVTHTLTLDGVYDGVGGVTDFEHFVLPDSFVDLTTVIFTGLRAGGLEGGVAVDNLEYQLENPEPIGACVLIPEIPSVAIAAPLPGAASGTIQVQATATDNVGVVGVQFKLDGVYLGSELVTAPYTQALDTTMVADGPHTLTAEARDAANNVGTATVVVTVRNSPPSTSPRYIELHGGNDHVQVPDADSLSFGNGTADRPFTIETWFRPATMTGKQNLVSKWWEGSVREYRLYVVPGAGLRLDLRDGSAGVTVSAISSSQAGLVGGWHHLAVTYDGRGGATAANGITFYIDGVAVPVTERNNNAAYVAMENWTAPLELGCEMAGFQAFTGGLDEVRLWNVVRTQSQVQAAMMSELTGTESGLVANWRFNEGAGTTVADDGPGNHTAALYSNTTLTDGGPLAP